MKIFLCPKCGAVNTEKSDSNNTAKKHWFVIALKLLSVMSMPRGRCRWCGAILGAPAGNELEVTVKSGQSFRIRQPKINKIECHDKIM
jgi:phage FluMu protein Com